MIVDFKSNDEISSTVTDTLSFPVLGLRGGSLGERGGVGREGERERGRDRGREGERERERGKEEGVEREGRREGETEGGREAETDV